MATTIRQLIKTRKMNSMRSATNLTGQAGIQAAAAGIFKRHFLSIALLALAACCYFAWTWNAQIGQLGTDGPAYLMMADHYAHGSAADPVYADVATYSRFPPLYPLLLAWCHASDDFRLIHLATTACLILALLAFYAWLLVEGLAPAQGALLTLLFAALPGTWLAGLIVQSEYLYLMWSLLAVALLAAYERHRAANVLYGAAMVIALATLTRAIGIALYAPLLLALLRAPRREALLALAASVLPVLIWSVLHRSKVSYTDALGLIYSGDHWGILRSQLASELPALRNGFGGNFLLQSPLRPIADILGLICLAGTLWRTIKLKPDALYTTVNLLILLVWPYPEEAQRFLWVLLPLLIVQPLLAFSGWRSEPPSARVPRLLTGMLSVPILAMTIPAFALASDRYRAAAYTDLPEARTFASWYGEDVDHAWDVVSIQTAIINSMHRITEDVPVNDCVISTRPDLINYFGRRRSYFPPLNSTQDPYFDRQLRAPGCHFVFGMSSADWRYPVTMFPLAKLGKNLDVVYYNSIPSASADRFKLTSMLVRLD